MGKFPLVPFVSCQPVVHASQFSRESIPSVVESNIARGRPAYLHIRHGPFFFFEDASAAPDDGSPIVCSWMGTVK